MWQSRHPHNIWRGVGEEKNDQDMNDNDCLECFEYPPAQGPDGLSSSSTGKTETSFTRRFLLTPPHPCRGPEPASLLPAKFLGQAEAERGVLIISTTILSGRMGIGMGVEHRMPDPGFTLAMLVDGLLLRGIELDSPRKITCLGEEWLARGAEFITVRIAAPNFGMLLMIWRDEPEEEEDSTTPKPNPNPIVVTLLPRRQHLDGVPLPLLGEKMRVEEGWPVESVGVPLF